MHGSDRHHLRMLLRQRQLGIVVGPDLIRVANKGLIGAAEPHSTEAYLVDPGGLQLCLVFEQRLFTIPKMNMVVENLLGGDAGGDDQRRSGKKRSQSQGKSSRVRSTAAESYSGDFRRPTRCRRARPDRRCRMQS